MSNHSPTVSSSDEEPPLNVMSEEAAVEVAKLSKKTPHKHTPAFPHSPVRLPATSRSSRSSTLASEASNAESLQNGAANEGTPLVTVGDNKRYNRKENFVNNFKSELELPPRTLSPPLSSTSPQPRPKATPYQNIPPPSPTPSTEDPHNIAFEGGPEHDERRDYAPPPRRERQRRPSKTVRVCRKVRCSCCLLGSLVILAGLVMMVVWPAAISTYTALPPDVTVLTGLVLVNPFNTLLRGGMTVLVNTSSIPDPSSLHTRAYYGPISNDMYNNGSHTLVLNTVPIRPSNTNNIFYMTPYIFEMGRINGSFTLDFTSTNKDVIVSVFVFNNSMDAIFNHIDEHTCASDEIDSGWHYSYNSSGDNCGVSNYGPNRYFLIQLVDRYRNFFKNYSFYPNIHWTSHGNLNISNSNTFECTPSAQSVTCDVSYGWFFPEMRSDTRVLISTNATQSSYTYNTILKFTVHEWYRGDVIGYFALLVFVIFFFVVACYLDYPNAWARLCMCGRWAWVRTKRGTTRGFNFLAGEDGEEEFPDGRGGGLQQEN